MQKTNRIIVMLFYLLFLFPIACEEGVPTISPVENGNFILFVSNQSFALDPVDIKVYIDNKLAVNRDFYCEYQHTWIKFQFNIKDGTHKLYCVSSKGGEKVDTTFIISETPFCVVEYWYYPKTVNSIYKKEITTRFYKYHPGFG